MENLLRDMPQVCVYLDDILVTGNSEEEHLDNLEKVLTKLEKAGLRLKKEKCSFFQASVNYLGYAIDGNGLHPMKNKIEAIRQAPKPTNVSQLEAHLGFSAYYNRFIYHQFYTPYTNC